MIVSALEILDHIAFTGGERPEIPGDYDLRWAHTSRRGCAVVPLPPASRCGTERGYQQHRRDGEDTCKPCRAAHVTHVCDNRRRRAGRQRAGESS